jgi:hypothetical protein
MWCEGLDNQVNPTVSNPSMPHRNGMMPLSNSAAAENQDTPANRPARPESPPSPFAPQEIGGRDGPEPTRYGDWEKNGRCIDF